MNRYLLFFLCIFLLAKTGQLSAHPYWTNNYSTPVKHLKGLKPANYGSLEIEQDIIVKRPFCPNQEKERDKLFVEQQENELEEGDVPASKKHVKGGAELAPVFYALAQGHIFDRGKITLPVYKCISHTSSSIYLLVQVFRI